MLSRVGWALTALAASSVGLIAPDAGGAVDDLHGPGLESALVGLASLVQLTLSLWVLLAAALHLLHAPAPVLRGITPRLLRRALLAGTAGAIALSPVHADRAVTPTGHAAHDLTGLRLPDRPIAAAAPAANRTVVVQAGDTLWAITARSLPRGATDAEIAAACSRWHKANRGVIGDDPDLIFPLQRLVPPFGKDPA